MQTPVAIIPMMSLHLFYSMIVVGGGGVVVEFWIPCFYRNAKPDSEIVSLEQDSQIFLPLWDHGADGLVTFGRCESGPCSNQTSYHYNNSAFGYPLICCLVPRRGFTYYLPCDLFLLYILLYVRLTPPTNGCLCAIHGIVRCPSAIAADFSVAFQYFIILDYCPWLRFMAQWWSDDGCYAFALIFRVQKLCFKPLITITMLRPSSVGLYLGKHT